MRRAPRADTVFASTDEHQVPAGVHLLHAGLGDLRHGEWVELRAGQVAVREWDPVTEELRPGREAAEDVAVRPLDVASGFGPYDAARNAPWGRLAGRVSAAVLARCRATMGVLFPAQEVSEVPVRGVETAQPEVPGVEAAPAHDGAAAAEQTARYTPLHLRRRAGMTPGEVTRYNLDGAVRLETVLAASFEGDWGLLLGELQAAFLLFLQISCCASPPAVDAPGRAPLPGRRACCDARRAHEPQLAPARLLEDALLLHLPQVDLAGGRAPGGVHGGHHPVRAAVGQGHDQVLQVPRVLDDGRRQAGLALDAEEPRKT